MVKTLLAFLAACVVTVFVVGCGGSGSDEDRIVSRIQSLLADANREDLNDTMANYSLDYCDDVDFCGGGTYQDERDCWLNTFTDPQTSVRFSDLEVVNVQVNPQGTEGFIDATVHFVVLDQFGGVIAEDDYSFRMFMVKENGQWLMWGDGNCAGSDAPKQPMKWKDRVGKDTKTGSPATRKG